MSDHRSTGDIDLRSDQQSTGDIDPGSNRSGKNSQDEPRMTFVKTPDMLSEWLSGVSNTEADNSPEAQENQRVNDPSAPL